MTEESVRTFLGSFLFTGEDVEKSISALSGGERARVSIAKLALNHDNFLVLDEPTNHLDIDSKEVLENALIDFEGTLLFVSHDRYFINRLATKVLEIGPEGTTLYLGDYDYYLHKKEEQYEQELAAKQAELEKSVKTSEGQNDSNTNRNNSWSDRKEIKRQTRRIERGIESTEKAIAETETALEKITQEMNDISNSDQVIQQGMSAEDGKRLNDLSKQFDDKNVELEQLFEDWEKWHEELEEYAE